MTAQAGAWHQQTTNAIYDAHFVLGTQQESEQNYDKKQSTKMFDQHQAQRMRRFIPESELCSSLSNRWGINAKPAMTIQVCAGEKSLGNLQ